MKGWYGNKYKHSLASRGIKIGGINKETWRESYNAKEGLVSEVPIDWLWQFRHERGQLPSNYDNWSVEEKQSIEDIKDEVIKSERDNIDRLKIDISENGLKSPLILEAGRDGRVHLGEGNHRLVALKELGYEKVPVIVIPYEFTLGGIEYFTDVQKTIRFPSPANPLNVFPDLEGYTIHPMLQKWDYKEEYR